VLAAAVSGMANRLRRLASFRPMPGACTTCMAMSSSGFRTAGTVATRARPTTGLHGAKRGVAIVLRVLRGGSWFDYQNFARSANRLRGYPEYRSPVIGFRVVCVADP